MTTFHMETDAALGMASQIRQAVEHMLTQIQSLSKSAQGMDWVGPNHDEFVSEIERLVSILLSQAEYSSTLAQRVEMEIQEWERMAATLSGSGSSLVSTAGGGTRIIPFLPVASFYTFFTLVGNLDIPDWVQSQIQKLFSPTAIPTPFVEQPASIDSPTEEIIQEKTYDSYYNVTPQDQGNLYGSAACGPTSVSMVMDYYHQKDSTNAAATPEEIIKGLEQGDGTYGSGVSLSRLDDDIKEYGYGVNWQTEANMDDLKTKLQDGPVIINGKVDLKGQDISIPGTQVNHSMVVKGISADKIVINDPWSGTEKEIPTDDFQKMWDSSDNVLYVIRP